MANYRYAKGDKDFIYWLAKLGYATAKDLQYLTGRPMVSTWVRLRALNRTGHIRYLPHPHNPFLRVHFLTQKGWDTAYEAPYHFTHYRVSATDEKSPLFIPHDLLLAQYLITFVKLEREGVISDLFFTTLHRDLYDRWGNGKNDRINADGFFSFRYRGVILAFFPEMKKGLSEHYVDGIPEEVRKMESYANYPIERFQERFNTDGDFFVLSLQPTVQKTMNHIAKLGESDNYLLRTRKFWAVDSSIISNPLERSYMTPKDDALSILDAVSFVD